MSYQCDSSCGEEELLSSVHRPICSLLKLTNGSAWSNYLGHSDPWKGKGQQHHLPTPFYRRDARRHWTVVVPQRALRHYYYYSRKVTLFCSSLHEYLRPPSFQRRTNSHIHTYTRTSISYDRANLREWCLPGCPRIEARDPAVNIIFEINSFGRKAASFGTYVGTIY
ncbi:hypothetical protein ACFW04_003173 [Cataglyphis niger]